MSFSFDPSIRMYKHNLEMLNAALDTMKLSEIEIKNIQGYVVTRQNFNVKGQVSSTNYDYGFDKIDLICKQRLGKDLHIFQVDTAAFPRIFYENIEPKEFIDLWHREHPDRSVQHMIRTSYENHIAYIVVHYDKSENNKKEEERKQLEEEEKKKKEKEEEERKKKEEEEEEERKRKEEEERKKKEEDDRKKVEELISKGNEEFQEKNYDEAISLYQEAISINPKKIECYLNLAKCHLEKKDYIKSIELCKYVCENTEDLSWKATAFGILGYSFRAQNKLDEALKAFEYSQMETNDPIIKEAYIETKELKEKQEAEAYINPEIAEIENLKANELYRTGKFSEALKVYEEAIKRNPKLPKYYTNRAQCKIKLMEYDQAIKDCETAIKIEPKTIKAYQKKANCHFITKEYDKVLKTIDDGMKFFPNDEVLREMKEKTILILTMN